LDLPEQREPQPRESRAGGALLGGRKEKSASLSPNQDLSLAKVLRWAIVARELAMLIPYARVESP
jgi:hypothetical protein